MALLLRDRVRKCGSNDLLNDRNLLFGLLVLLFAFDARPESLPPQGASGDANSSGRLLETRNIKMACRIVRNCGDHSFVVGGRGRVLLIRDWLIK
jgi:hypothetical protein